MDKITEQWSIHRSFRQANVNGLMLVTTNDRTEGGLGPIRWAVFTEAQPRILLEEGRTFQGINYSALVRQAMLDCERAAARIAADPVGRETGRTWGQWVVSLVPETEGELREAWGK